MPEVPHSGNRTCGPFAEDRQHKLLEQAVSEDGHHRLLVRLNGAISPHMLHVRDTLRATQAKRCTPTVSTARQQLEPL